MDEPLKPPAPPSAAATANVAADVGKLQALAGEQADELALLRSLVHVMREDLSVKDEQFDFLYASLKVASLWCLPQLSRKRNPWIKAS